MLQAQRFTADCHLGGARGELLGDFGGRLVLQDDHVVGPVGGVVFRSQQ
ncbi:hypothetical protein SBI_00009 [Streptomyces bingchenggensis BCW-1]|uniref:Uncharacterized protein n=1 Tax=Streptomyces bingchenggensis (strain BCW-1) TaxID=749414 RepID=D7BSV3_STRBB|nr:hypothetical protein SBI_00009 [Streptomyces bingchenggensis BCW-1]